MKKLKNQLKKLKSENEYYKGEYKALLSLMKFSTSNLLKGNFNPRNWIKLLKTLTLQLFITEGKIFLLLWVKVEKIER